MAQILVSPLPTAEVTSLLLDLEAMLLKTGLGCLQHNCTSDPRMRDGIVDLLIDLPRTRSGSPTFAVICVQSEQSYLEAKDIPRIHKCIRRYQAHQTLVLLMVQSLATLQAFEQLLVDDVRLLTPPKHLSKRVTPPTLTLTSTPTLTLTPTLTQTLTPFVTNMLSKGSVDLPRVAPYFSVQDAVLYLQRLLEAHLHAPPRSFPSERLTPLHQLLVNQYGPIASTRECERLGTGLGTLQNIGLASSTEIRNACRLRTQLASTIHEFFETDQPL